MVIKMCVICEFQTKIFTCLKTLSTNGNSKENDKVHIEENALSRFRSSVCGWKKILKFPITSIYVNIIKIKSGCCQIRVTFAIFLSFVTQSCKALLVNM